MFYMCVDEKDPVKISNDEAHTLLRGGVIEVKRHWLSGGNFTVEMMDRFKNQIQVTNITKLAYG